MFAAHRGCVRCIDQLVSAGAPVDTKSPGRRPWTALSLAAARRLPNAVVRVLQHGADTRRVRNTVALHTAVWHKPPSACNCGSAPPCALCAALTALESRAARGRPNAARRGESVVHALVSAGTQTDYRCHGFTALFWAVRQGDTGMARALTLRGARAMDAEPDGALLVTATRSRDGAAPDMLRIVIAAAGGHMWPREAMQLALFTAVHRGCAASVTLLIGCAGSDINAPYAWRPTMVPMLHAACAGACGLPVLQALLAAGAAAEPCAPTYWPSPLWLAVCARQAPAVAALVTHGARATTRSPATSCTALMLAVILGDLDTVRALLCATPDGIDYVNAAGSTALSWALQTRRPDITTLLAVAGARVVPGAAAAAPPNRACLAGLIAEAVAAAVGGDQGAHPLQPSGGTARGDLVEREWHGAAGGAEQQQRDLNVDDGGTQVAARSVSAPQVRFCPDVTVGYYHSSESDNQSSRESTASSEGDSGGHNKTRSAAEQLFATLGLHNASACVGSTRQSAGSVHTPAGSLDRMRGDLSTASMNAIKTNIDTVATDQISHTAQPLKDDLGIDLDSLAKATAGQRWNGGGLNKASCLHCLFDTCTSVPGDKVYLTKQRSSLGEWMLRRRGQLTG